jgi:hypothetical protein
MTLEMRSFGSTDSVTMTPFMFYGRRFHAKSPSIRAVRLLGGMDAEGSVVEMVSALVDYLAACLPATEREDFRALIDGDEVDIDVADLRDLATWIGGLAGGDPLDRSLNGPMSNGATSEGGSTLPDYTTDPIPTS